MRDVTVYRQFGRARGGANTQQESVSAGTQGLCGVVERPGRAGRDEL